MEPTVNLTPSEVFFAAVVGIMRQVENLTKKREDKFGCPKDMGWQVHIEGACGEAAVAKWLDRWWSGNLGNLKADDVGSLQVRTRSKERYSLILHPSDPDDRIFILVVGVAPKYRLVGWMYGKEGKKKEFWSDPAGGRPAYFVPPERLNSMDDLIC